MDLFVNLKNLLCDICTFLEKEVVRSQLPTDAKSMAISILQRSSKMADEIRSIDCTLDGYIDMHKTPSSGVEYYVETDAPSAVLSAQEQDYSTLDEVADYTEATSRPSPTPSPTTLTCPYKQALYSQLPVIVKEDQLNRKEYLLHWFSVQRTYHVVLLDEWLMFFNASRSKLLENYSIRSCYARHAEDDTSGFEITVENDTRCLQMFAKTRADKLQWTAAINAKARPPEEQPLLRAEGGEGTCGIRIKLKHDSLTSNESNTYQEIDVSGGDNRISNVEYVNATKPTLPPRCKPPLPEKPGANNKPAAPPVEDDSDDTYDYLGSEAAPKSDNKEVEEKDGDDDDDDDDDDDTYDYLGPPPPPSVVSLQPTPNTQPDDNVCCLKQMHGANDNAVITDVLSFDKTIAKPPKPPASKYMKLKSKLERPKRTQSESGDDEMRAIRESSRKTRTSFSFVGKGRKTK